LAGEEILLSACKSAPIIHSKESSQAGKKVTPKNPAGKNIRGEIVRCGAERDLGRGETYIKEGEKGSILGGGRKSYVVGWQDDKNSLK